MIAFNAQNMHHRVDPGSLPINRQEVYRYLGYYRVTPDDAVSAMIETCLEDEMKVLSPQGIYSIFKADVTGNGNIDLGFARTYSLDLTRNLSGCDHIVLFAATIGPKVDMLIQRASRLEPAKAIIYQSVGAMLIESYCNCLNDYLKTEFAEGGYRLKPRFSPGYGDLPLELQRDIFKSIRADKTIGLTLMDSCIMAPSKSVTAIIGITSDRDTGCDYLPGCNKCDVCKFNDK